MSKKTQSRQRAAASRGKRRGQGGNILIPIGVAVVILAVIIGVLFSLENQPADIPYPEVSRISVNETRDKLEAGEIILVDVRSEASYNSQHIAGAVSIPEQEVGSRLSELPVDQEIVLYCT
jgi:hypothetical protein